MHERVLDCLADPGSEAGAVPARIVRCLRPDDLAAALDAMPSVEAAWARANDFAARPGQLLRLPGADGGIAGLLLGIAPGPHGFGGLAAELADHAAPAVADAPPVLWRLSLPPGASADDAVLGFCLGAYRFDRLRRAGDDVRAAVRLLRPEGATGEGEAIARATWLARDLINAPPNLLGPVELADSAAAVLRGVGARVEVVSGDDLAGRYPAVHAVGAGSERPPRVVVARWHGSAAPADAPLLSLCGKGVCFDTGGYDLKQPAGMLRMKKDMGGAAICLALARVVVALDLPVRLELRLGCVENSVSGRAMRPSD
ncbi:MAG: leucyl aminopeptidase family protein, partial [Gluconacetobacter diazotrophicus]|nr:leucyl aminopeptidase family protein [Gluconacetobacter diazotrophicus]